MSLRKIHVSYYITKLIFSLDYSNSNITIDIVYIHSEMATLFYKALTQTPEKLKNELERRNLNEEIKLEINEQSGFDNPHETEFMGDDTSNSMVWIDEYMCQEMKLPVPNDVFQHIQRYNQLFEMQNMEIEMFDEMLTEMEEEHYNDFEENEALQETEYD